MMYNQNMQEHDELRRDYLHDSSMFKQQDLEDTELAYLLQRSHPLDRKTIELLVLRYAEKLYKWIGIALFYQQFSIPEQHKILSILQDVFVEASQNAGRFIGQSSILAWLFSLSYTITKRSKSLIPGYIAGKKRARKLTESAALQEEAANVDRLQEKLRFPLLLKCLFGFEVREIGHILGLQPQEVHNRLVRARNQLAGSVGNVHMGTQIQANVDELLGEEPGKLNQLQQHLADCPDCRAAETKLIGLEKLVVEVLQTRWKFLKIPDHEINGFIEAITVKINQPKVQISQVPVRQTAWMIGFLLIFAGLAFVFIRLTPIEREFPLHAPTTTAYIPADRNISGNASSITNPLGMADVLLYVHSALSSNGVWVVIEKYSYDPEMQKPLAQTIELFNRQLNKMQLISNSNAHLSEPYSFNFPPAISGDGRYIVYSSSANAPYIQGKPCQTLDHNDCLDIILYDRFSGSIRRLTQGANGAGANGDSIAPTISENGQWLAFWSSASNLVAGDTDVCQLEQNSISCMYIYLYNLQYGSVERLPIKRNESYGIKISSISLSADGRFIGFTLTSLDGTGGILTPRNKDGSQAVVYDRITGKYELEDQAQDGTPGNDASSSPILTADGRYVAFISSSTNLVDGDNNQRNDIFIRDRETGRIELISQSSDGGQGIENSGSEYLDFPNYSLQISADGRYVAFESRATDLGKMSDTECDWLHAECTVLCVHDRQTHSTEIISTLMYGGFSSAPDISENGRWVIFTQVNHNCTLIGNFCWTAMLYDRQDSLMSSLSRYDQPATVLPWTYVDRAVIPWRAEESTAVAFSPDGRLIALGGKDSIVRIWSLTEEGNYIKSGEPVELDTADGEQITALAFSPNGDWIAAGTLSGHVYIWKPPDGNQLYVLNDQSYLVKKVVFSQDGRYMISSTFYDTWIYSLVGGGITRLNHISYGIVIAFAVDITPKGDMLATSRGDGSIWLQSLPSGILLGELNSRQLDVSSLSFSEDGSLLAARSFDKTIDIWQIGADGNLNRSINLINTIQSYGYTGTLAFLPDNRYIVAASEDGEITFWNLPEGELFIVSPLLSQGVVYNMIFSEVGDKAAEVFRNNIMLLTIP